MAIVKVHNKERNITYVYESVSYWDKDLKQPRSHRKLIGRIDPATGEVVPTARKIKADITLSAHSDTDYEALYKQALSIIGQKDAQITELQKRLQDAENRNKAYRHSIRKASDILMDSVSGKERSDD